MAVLFMAAVSFTNCSSSGMMGDDSKSVMVGGAAMLPTKNIVENAMNSSEHTTLVAAVKAAELVETLQGTGPFTVFAPTNAAFDLLPTGSVDLLVKPYNKITLTKILTSHVVAGRMSGADLTRMIKDGNGSASVTTLSGHKLMLSRQGDAILIKDENGGTAVVTTANVYQSNGVIHVIDHVLIPS
ncbi:MAG: fasciclin domain-containing protein [Ferruginibacter sp.]|nr:fasciclin domain-containing protein [Ferruginibacter sp.]